MRQQRRRNRPNAQDILGVQPPQFNPTSIALVDPNTLEFEFPVEVFIQGLPNYRAGSANAIAWNQTSPTIVEVEFDAAIANSARLVTQAWFPGLRGTEGQWLAPMDLEINPAPPTPPGLVWLAGPPVATGTNIVTVQVSSPMATPTGLTMLRTASVQFPVSLADVGGGTTWELTYGSFISPGENLFQDAYDPTWLGTTGQFLAPGQFRCV